MSRTIKQILYGIFYVVVLGIIAFGVYGIFLKPQPSCFDHIQDEGELGVDCGGPCAALCTAQLSPITGVGLVSSFAATPGSGTFLGQIENANADFGSENIAYSFENLDASGRILSMIPAETFLYPSQTKYVVAVNQPLPQGTAQTVLVVATGTPWTASGTMGPPPQFNFQNIVTEAASGTTSVSGQIVNIGTVPATRVTVIALFKNNLRTPVQVSETEIDAIPVGSPADFTINAPGSLSVDPSATELEAYSLEQ